MLRALATICGAFVLLGSSALPSQAAEPPPSFSVGSLPTSAWSHLPSGFVFREKIAGFQRGEAIQYDATGTDVSVAYDFFDPRIVATVYVYPTGGLTLDQELARRQREITTKYPAAQLVSTDKVGATPKNSEVLRATYAIPKMFPGMDEPMHSILLVGQQGKFFIEYRISFPVSGGETAEAAARSFYGEFAWP